LSGLLKTLLSGVRRSIRPLDPIDFLRCQAFGSPKGSNRAHTFRGAANMNRRPALWDVARAGMMPTRRSVAWVSTAGSRINALSIARPRSGPQSWEVTHLIAGSGDEHDDLAGGLLDALANSTARQGAERVFLRLRSNDPLIVKAQHGGFFPCVSEVLYERGPVVWRWQREDGIALNRMEPSDDYDAFRLYNSATPAEVRHASAMTFDQWRACREQRGGRWRQLLLRSSNGIDAWVATHRDPWTGWLSIIARPDVESRLGSLVDLALGRLKGVRKVYCLVPEYQIAFQSALLRRDFRPGPEFTILVKSNASAVRERAAAKVGVGTT